MSEPIAELHRALPPRQNLGDATEVDIIRIPQEELLKQIEAATVRDGRLVLSTDQGEIVLTISTMPDRSESTGFWSRIGLSLPSVLDGASTTDQESEVPKRALEIRQPIDTDVLDVASGEHTQLMGYHPWVVMESGMRYAVTVEAPSALGNQVHRYRETVSDPQHFGMGPQKIQIGVQYRTLVVFAIVDGDKSLARQEVASYVPGMKTYGAQLFGFKPTDNPDVIKCEIDRRTTWPAKYMGSEAGDTSKVTALEADLVFNAPQDGTIKGDIEDQKGTVRVVVCTATIKQVHEEVDVPAPTISGGFGDHFGGGTVMRSMGGGGYSAGQTAFSKPKPRKISVVAVTDVEPIGEFKLVAVQERPENDRIVGEAPLESTEPHRVSNPDAAAQMESFHGVPVSAFRPFNDGFCEYVSPLGAQRRGRITSIETRGQNLLVVNLREVEELSGLIERWHASQESATAIYISSADNRFAEGTDLESLGNSVLIVGAGDDFQKERIRLTTPTGFTLEDLVELLGETTYRGGKFSVTDPKTQRSYRGDIAEIGIAPQPDTTFICPHVNMVEESPDGREWTSVKRNDPCRLYGFAFVEPTGYLSAIPATATLQNAEGVQLELSRRRQTW